IRDDGKHRTRVNDIRQILVGADADIDAARFYALMQVVDDVQVGCLVGDEVIGIKIPFRFRPLIDVSAELLDRNLKVPRRLRLFVSPRYGSRAKNQEQRESQTEK